MRLNSTGKNPCGPLAGIRDRDRRPCEGSSKASAAQPVVSARAASRGLFPVRTRRGAQTRGADVRSSRSNLPYTLCAMPEYGPALVTRGCAMIFGSSGQYVKLLYTSHVTWRSTPMGIDRSNLSRRTILFFFTLLIMRGSASPATIEDYARELARKVAASFPVGGHLSLEVRNLSSLGANDVSVIELTLANELRDQAAPSPQNGTDVVNVRVTLSESIKSFVWAAETDRDGSAQILLLAVPRSSSNRIVSSAMPVTLRSEKFWEGSQPILDAIPAKAANGDPFVMLLAPDGIQIRNVGSDDVSIVPIPVDLRTPRDPAGRLEQTDNGILFKSRSQVCRIDIDANALVACSRTDGPPSGRVFEKLEVGVPGPTHVERGSQVIAVVSSCGAERLFLTTGTGDYTQSDAIQAFESTAVNGVFVEKRLSDFLHLPGPVMALQFDEVTPRAIVRNLQTGNYEAYHISITCADQ
jgi:hypothetical protein